MGESDIERMSRRVDEMVERLLGRHYAEFCPTHAWVPAVNVYALADRAEVCVELAGIDRESIDVQAEPRRIVIRGQRAAPRPPADEAAQLVAMEIDYGQFERTIILPREVSVARVEARLNQGLMWLSLPWK